MHVGLLFYLKQIISLFGYIIICLTIPLLRYIYSFFTITDGTTVNNVVHMLLHSSISISVEHIPRNIVYIVKFFILSNFSLPEVVPGCTLANGVR